MEPGPELRQLIVVGQRLCQTLHPELVYDQLLGAARDSTEAGVACLTVLDPGGGASRVITSGAGAQPDAPTAPSALPAPTAPAELGAAATGASPGEALSVPVLIHGEPWGTLTVSQRTGGGAFTPADAVALGILADFAGTAIDNARIHRETERARLEAIRALRGLEAARTISGAIGTEVDLETVLELIATRGRTLVGARSVLILLARGDHLTIVAGTGTTADRRGTVVAREGSISDRVLASGKPRRVDEVTMALANLRERVGIADVRSALIVPMIHRGHGVGVLIALDRGEEQLPFSDMDESLLHAFASAAASAVTLSHTVESDRLASAIDAAESERRRWARELHDQTLQSLGALRIQLAGARRRDELGHFRECVEHAVSDLEYEIANLRGIIADLRPPLLDDLGLADALTALIRRHRERGLFAVLALDLDGADGAAAALGAELEITVYRLIQEALTNVVKHARAGAVQVEVGVSAEAGTIRLEVRDDGRGFDPSLTGSGFGMAGMRERVYLAGGSLDVRSGARGTTVHVELPLARSGRAEPPPSRAGDPVTVGPRTPVR